MGCSRRPPGLASGAAARGPELTRFSGRSVLTGLHPPTSGAVLVHGRSLHTDLAAIRRELGVCPQRDVLLDNLTVLEHLRLFAAIKAPHWTQRTLRREVNRSAPALPAPSCP